MSSFGNRIKRLSFRSVRWPVKLLAKPSVLPEKAIDDLDIDLQQPVYYVLNQYSATDLNLLQQVCKQQGLPLPLAPGNKSGYIFILKKRHFWNRDAYYNRHHEKIKTLLERQASSDKINIQFVPVTVRWGRNPGKEPSLIRLFFSGTVRSLGFFQKAMALIFFGRSTLVTFGRPIDISNILGRDSTADHRSLTFARQLRVYFHNQKTASLGPNLYDRRTLIKDLVDQPSVQKAIEQESRKKKMPITKARKNAMSYAWEISGNFSYFMLRVMEKLLGLILRKIYDGVDVNHADRLREMARDNELVYVPCHRSHMDYLLVSYVLFHQGLVPPHIAAGINLNFWPIGAMLRQGGAFFLRRSFSGNKLYSAVFNEYLTTLFNRGYSVEYFPEGGRSRTGRLLPPKTGMLSMTLENVIRGRKKPLLFVPVYIGYDKIMEGKSYLGELRGGSKQSES
ncbi:MAG: glycerol-3-phosphate 1-O-acyltransferase PlsB, partial [Enterobacterales bacterium]|nr:glycerol-3-phosphate 1-O-acyltransferase PlsB [Enterobacterales bacterium]